MPSISLKPGAIPARPKPLALVVLDGWGISHRVEGNAIALAKTPTMSGLKARYPHSQLQACGEALGLLEGQMGDSNVGHLNIGAGRIVYQDLVRIHRSIARGDFYRNQVFLSAMNWAKQNGGTLHLMGLLSDGGVHSHQEHLYALLELAARRGVPRVRIHCFMDGRDTPPTSGLGFIRSLEARLQKNDSVRIATVMGRYYAMDRDKRWERTKKAFEAIVFGNGRRAASAVEAVQKAYELGETDEFIVPTVIDDTVKVKQEDALILFNFRADRARQICGALADPGFSHFDRNGYKPAYVVGMTQYEEDLGVPSAFPPIYLKNTFGEVVSKSGMRQLRIAETEKYAHVTFFFNGMREEPFEGEDRVLIPSPKVATYDLKPEMSAYELTQEVLRRIASDQYDVIIMNFANPDMVGHTGSLQAAIKAIEVVDECLGRVLSAVRQAGGAAIVCSDHGNAEEMVEPDSGQPHTAHTSNPVPCILVDDRPARLRNGILADIAPTLLELLGLEKPEEMDGESLIVTEGSK
ncbi:MAG TPA: 2,3-bisphosphoglycerate-independent phosphoglycerate mutase [Firmicutes bacterium]|nr:2,3-bisphosphoglycerate-independent phosphoglycerate mutase [Bacillota bacterium]